MNYENKFNNILDHDETIQWIGVPNGMAFMSGGLLILVAAILWVLFTFFIFSDVLTSYRDFIFISFPVWASILCVIWRYHAYSTTFYACTDKRIMIRSGFFGTNFQIFGYDKINNIQIDINPIEKMYGVGSILFNPTSLTSNFFTPFDNFGWVKNTRFICIENPYDVFRQIKKLSQNANNKSFKEE
jgi:membrane protein YdbS with pleckstrin-like domain